MEEDYHCPECRKVFGSEDTLETHAQREHGKRLEDMVFEKPGLDIGSKLGHVLNRYFAAGFLVGVILTATVMGAGFAYYLSMDERPQVPITVVTCEECEYEAFVTATDRMINAEYVEADYQSDQGQELIENYDIEYVPAFIFDKKVEETEAFDRLRQSLIEYDDGYKLMEDEVEVAQRMSEGIYLEE